MQTKIKNVLFKLNINIIHAREMLELYNIILFYVKRINKLTDAIKTTIFIVNAIMRAFANSYEKFFTQ